jgi:hypothetical protein
VSLSFDNSAHQYVGCSAGTIGPTGSGNYTIVTLARPQSGNDGVVSLLSGSLTGTIEREIIVDTGAWYGANDFTSGFGSSTINTWYLTGQSKATGSNPYRWHTWPYAANGSGTKTHGNATSNFNDGSAIAGIRIGDGDDKGFGEVALVAIWKRVLSDADFNALCGGTAQAFIDLSTGAPDALLLCNVATPGAVVDSTGNGANATTVVGSGITIGADPPSFDFSLSFGSPSAVVSWFTA